MPPARRLLRLLECGLLYGLAPAMLDLRVMGGRFLPILLGVALLMAALLYRDPSFETRDLWRGAALREALPRMLLAWLPAALLLIGFTAWVATLPSTPEQIALFNMPLERPQLWVLILLFYPLFSVYPQEIIFRAWFFHRYEEALGGRWPAILAGGVLFGWAHVIFDNPAAVLLCIPGGVLFGWTYRRTRSLLTSSVEHGLYGDWIFTVGLGWWFYGGSVGATG